MIIPIYCLFTYTIHTHTLCTRTSREGEGKREKREGRRKKKGGWRAQSKSKEVIKDSIKFKRGEKSTCSFIYVICIIVGGSYRILPLMHLGEFKFVLGDSFES